MDALLWLNAATWLLIGGGLGGGVVLLCDARERRALERIACRVWGPGWSERLNAKGGADELAAEIDRRVPEAIGDGALAGRVVASCLREGRTHRFRAQVGNVELGVSVEERFLTITHLGTKGVPSLVTQADGFERAASVVVREAAKELAHVTTPADQEGLANRNTLTQGKGKGRHAVTTLRVEERETRVDGYGRLSEWVRFAER